MLSVASIIVSECYLRFILFKPLKTQYRLSVIYRMFLLINHIKNKKNNSELFIEGNKGSLLFLIFSKRSK